MAKKQFGEFDSDEERYFEWYLEELHGYGIVLGYVYQPDSFELFTGVRYKKEHKKVLKTKTNEWVAEHSLLNPHVYTPDYKIIWDRIALKLFVNIIGERVKEDKPFWGHLDSSNSDLFTYLDVKGGFVGRNNSSAVLFPNNQKWVYEKYKIFVQKIVVSNKKESIFKKTFTPAKYKITERSFKPRVIHYSPILTLEQFINQK